MNIKYKYKKLINKINSFDFSNYSNGDFRDRTNELKKEVKAGKSLDSILPEAFALVREASTRVLGMKHYDVQLIGGIVIHGGAIAEMSTGAGKTLTATLPLYLNALSGNGVHLVTVNDYLAKRDCEWMMPLYDFLGVSCGYIIHDTTPEERKDIYTRDIVYITNQELGFDYLRDNMVKDIDERVGCTRFNFAIIDEADSILIDESRTPLIISTQGSESTDIYRQCELFMSVLNDKDVEKDEDSNSWSLTASGIRKAEQGFQLKNYSDAEYIVLRHHIEQALKAHYEMKKDKHYIVKDDSVVLIDEHTGRIADGRRYNDGLHQAIEAKEKVTIKNESVTLASITYQNFFKQYNKYSGMTGTAMTEKKEFKEIYNLKVVSIPDNKPNIRIDRNDLIYVTEEAKIDAIIKDVKEQHAKHRPVLIGTLDIEKSEALSKRLLKEGISHNLLNAKQNEQEAEIVSQAGQLDAVTIATNMAGRGTDIKLGEGVSEIGGLKIIASERAVDRRIDNQLIGRAGRQGDPGESQFYLSFDDELMEYATGSSKEKLLKLDKNDKDPIEAGYLTSLIYSCQKKIESKHFESRKHTTKYDKILNNQRINIYNQRDFVLKNDCSNLVINMIKPVITTEYSKFIPGKEIEGLKKIFNIDSASVEDGVEIATEKITNYLKEIDSKQLTKLILYVVDAYWVRYMEDMESLRQDVRGASFRNEDPVHVFNKKSTEKFEEMNYNIKKDIVRNILVNL